MFLDRGETKIEFNSVAEAIAAVPTDVLDREIARLEAAQAAKEGSRGKKEGHAAWCQSRLCR
jgi:uncharacterized small protein (DUF1192 family)